MKYDVEISVLLVMLISVQSYKCLLGMNLFSDPAMQLSSLHVTIIATANTILQKLWFELNIEVIAN